MRLKFIMVLLSVFVLTSCASQGVPAGAVAWCGSFDYTGTFTKSETAGRALGLSDSDLAARLTVEDVIALAESMGCNSN
jgi:hypothetical protein